MFVLLSLYMRQVLGFWAMETGVGYLAVALRGKDLQQTGEPVPVPA